ncbi:MAG TPA: shikimate dehydrogenase [Candidatus Saccharimonadia bacterium]|nr:shikimate dehydrogenase [Candidatus Saccharimonadia bacterium]
MLYAALIGHPVNHSASPVLYGELARMAGLGPNDFAYLKIDVTAQNLSRAFDQLEQLGFIGGNITLPYKIDAMKLVKPDEAAQFIGAVNTYVLQDGRRLGFNTDWQGAYGALKRAGVTPGGTFVVLGTGGAARAVIYAAKQLGFTDIRAFYEEPTDAKTQDLQTRAAELGITLHPYDHHLESALATAAVIYNATSTGMTGQAPAPFDLNRLSSLSLNHAIAADAVFEPVQTPFLQATKQAGARTVDGIWWTLYQGHPSFNLWTNLGTEPTPEQLEHLHDVMAQVLSSPTPARA